jgi:hypothetical protein
MVAGNSSKGAGVWGISAQGRESGTYDGVRARKASDNMPAFFKALTHTGWETEKRDTVCRGGQLCYQGTSS